MDTIAPARGYAQAAMNLALQDNSLERWRTDLSLLRDLWGQDEVRSYLEDVRINKQKREERLRQILASRISPQALNLVLLLNARGRLSLIPYIARLFEDIERERERKVIAQVTTTEPLSPPLRANLQKQLQEQTGREVELQEHVDPAILGGMVLKIGDQLLDLSVAGRLRRLREQVSGQTVGAR